MCKKKTETENVAKRKRLEKKLHTLQDQQRLNKFRQGVWQDIPSKLPEVIEKFEHKNKEIRDILNTK